MLGELSKFQRITVTPSENTNISFSHSLGVVPKIIIVNGDPDFSGGATYLFSGVFNQLTGAMLSGTTYAPNAYTTTINETGTSNAHCYLSDTEVMIRRSSSARYFDTNCAYTIDLYA